MYQVTITKSMQISRGDVAKVVFAIRNQHFLYLSTSTS